MKTVLKAIAVGTAIALGTAVMPATSYAGEHYRGDNGWNTAVAVIAGVAIVGTIAAIASQHDHDRSYGRHDYCPPPPGHYEIRHQRVCIPGYWDTVVTPAEYGWVRYGCRWSYVVVRPECARRVWVPERTEWQETRVWVPGHVEPGPYAYN
jgi:hypothetical protein